MNQQNSKLCLIVMVVLLFSGKSHSSERSEATTPMIHTTHPTENYTFTPLSTTSTHHDPCTNNCLTSQPSKKVSPTISQSSSAIKILEDVHNGNIANANTKANKLLLKTTENFTHILISSSSSENILESLPNNSKLIGIVLLPILVLFLLGLIIAILLNCSRGKRQRINDVSCESPASPIFEEDVASVMEVEMDEVNKWMGSMKEKTQNESLLDVSEDKN
ncbi:transmembrane protein 154-like [Pristis pectinata]|uniref:transmembrane protein 154-like n=1 Tax=Pristis pectinata TaxID=685728 RepID=UPI00223E6DF2|nr:transmembrane protein 154-like [Pristis pectinata]